MQSFPEKRKGLAENLATAFCSASEFLSETKIGGITVGAVLLIAALFSAFMAYSYFDTPLFAYLFIIVAIPGHLAYILVCKRDGLGDYLLEPGLRYAGLGVGWLITYAFLDMDSFFGGFAHHYWAIRRRWNMCSIPQVVPRDIAPFTRP